MNWATNTTVNLAPNSSQTLTLIATGLNGFTGSIALGSQWAFQSPCLSLLNLPATIFTNTQVNVTVQNSNCPAGTDAMLFVGGTAYPTDPNHGIHRVASNTDVLLNAVPGGTFIVTVGSPSPAVLTQQTGSVSYPITVSSVNGAYGWVTLSVANMPAGITDSVPNQGQVYVSSGGNSSTALTLYPAANMPPGGTYSLSLMMQGTVAAVFPLSVQVTTFQVASPTASAIVHNTGQEVQVTHTVPAGNAPNVSTCSSLDPNVTCRVISSSPGTIILGITASPGAVHGTRPLQLNAGATTVHVAVADYENDSGLPTITVQAGGSGSANIDLQLPCEPEGPCDATIDLIAPIFASYYSSFNSITVFADPPTDTVPGSYSYTLNVCSMFWDPDDDYSCESGTGDIEVEVAPAPPPTPSLIVTSNGRVIPNLSCANASLSQALYIDGTPSMPSISAQIVMSDGSQPVGQATWQLSVTFSQQNTNLNPPAWPVTVLYPQICMAPRPLPGPAANGYQGPGCPYVFGGDATLAWTYNGVNQPPVNFCILGQNPTQQTVQSQVQSLSSLWFAPKIISKESRDSQFCDGTSAMNVFAYCRTGGDYVVGMPLFGSPGGYGVGQLDPPRDQSQLWDWTQNLSAALSYLNTLSGVDDWTTQYNSWLQYNALHPQNPAKPPDDDPEGPCTFSLNPTGSNGHPFSDAVWVFHYNTGPKGTPYIQFNSNTGKWDFNDNYGYVAKVCQAPVY